MNIGIYTNWYDWQQITGNANSIIAGDLWYWNTLGIGSQAESARDFSDFRTFGPFRQYPQAKQYGIWESPCGIGANQNVFPASSLKSLDGLSEGNSFLIGHGARYLDVDLDENRTKKVEISIGNGASLDLKV